MVRALVIAVALLAACARANPAPDPSAIIAAERAFAARAAEAGWLAAFHQYAAPDGINLTPDPGNAQAWLAQQPGDGEKDLIWWPIHAGISAAGDLGFTTGPSRIGGTPLGNYFTIWKKQPDGGWKWIFDAGGGAPAANPPGPDASPSVLPAATGKAVSAQAALAEVDALEVKMGQGMDLSATNVAALAPDAWALREKQPPAQGEAARLLIGAGPNFGAVKRLGGTAAASGDLVFTYGEMTWREGEGQRRGHYARVWQHRAEGWKIVFDEIVPVREP